MKTIFLSICFIVFSGVAEARCIGNHHNDTPIYPADLINQAFAQMSKDSPSRDTASPLIEVKITIDSGATIKDLCETFAKLFNMPYHIDKDVRCRPVLPCVFERRMSRIDTLKLLNHALWPYSAYATYDDDILWIRRDYKLDDRCCGRDLIHPFPDPKTVTP